MGTRHNQGSPSILKTDRLSCAGSLGPAELCPQRHHWGDSRDLRADFFIFTHSCVKFTKIINRNH